MKTRTGFVPNSSSSSFICDCCGDENIGMDLCLSDTDKLQCVHGHIFCKEHLNKTNSEKIKTDIMNNITENINIESEKLKIAANIKKFNDVDKHLKIINNLKNELENIDDVDNDFFSDDIDEKMCPICSLSHIKSDDVLNYLLKKLSSHRDEVCNEIRGKYSDYKSLKFSLKN